MGVLRRNAAEVCGNAFECLYVNSWCLAFESMAMWEIYGSRDYGLAVKSSVGQYRRASKFDLRADQYDFGKVEYHEDLGSSLEIQRDFRSGAIPVGSGVWQEVLGLGFNKRLATNTRTNGGRFCTRTIDQRSGAFVSISIWRS
jgi:hypothetical protein